MEGLKAQDECFGTFRCQLPQIGRLTWMNPHVSSHFLKQRHPHIIISEHGVTLKSSQMFDNISVIIEIHARRMPITQKIYHIELSDRNNVKQLHYTSIFGENKHH